MTTVDFIIELFCRIADVMNDIPKRGYIPVRSHALGVLFALKEVGNRQFYH